MSSHSYRLTSSVPSCICCTKTNKQRTPLMRRWSTSKLNFSIQCPSYFLLFLSFFFLGVAFAKKLRSSTAYLCQKKPTWKEFWSWHKTTHKQKQRETAKERERERERVRVRVRVWLFASFENVRKWAVSEHGSHCHGCCCGCSYGEDGSSNNTRSNKNINNRRPFVFCSSLCTQTAANSSESVYVCLNFYFIFFGSNFGQFFNTLSNDRRLWRFVNCDRYSLPINFIAFFFSVFAQVCDFPCHKTYFAKLARN